MSTIEPETELDPDEATEQEEDAGVVEVEKEEKQQVRIEP